MAANRVSTKSHEAAATGQSFADVKIDIDALAKLHMRIGILVRQVILRATKEYGVSVPTELVTEAVFLSLLKNIDQLKAKDDIISYSLSVAFEVILKYVDGVKRGRISAHKRIGEHLNEQLARLDEFAAANPERKISEYLLEFFPELAEIYASHESSVGARASSVVADRETVSRREVPEVAPKLWADREPGENPVTFVRKHYGVWREDGTWDSLGLTKADYRRLDRQGYQALATWENRHPEEQLGLPTREEVNTSWVTRVGHDDPQVRARELERQAKALRRGAGRETVSRGEVLIAAPKLWADREPGDNPASFVRKHYGVVLDDGTWDRNGLTKPALRQADFKLYEALAVWERRHPEDRLDLPNRTEVSDRWVDRVLSGDEPAPHDVKGLQRLTGAIRRQSSREK